MFNSVKRMISAVAPGVAAAVRERRQQQSMLRADDRSPAEIFGEIYRNNIWGGKTGDFYSGSGSDVEAVTLAYVAIVRDYIEQQEIRSVVDLGCGDFRVGAQLVSTGVRYIGVDVVPELIARNQAEYGSDHVHFEVGDIIAGGLPDGELYLVRQVLQHLSNIQIAAVLEKLRDKPHVLIAEHHPAPSRFKSFNRDKTPGQVTRVPFGSGVYPDQPPFDFPSEVIARTDVAPLVLAGEQIAIYAKT